MHLLSASVLCELPKSTHEDEFNIKGQNIRKIILIRSCKNTNVYWTVYRFNS